MRSRAEAPRRALEWALRGVALAALAVALWRAWRPGAAPRDARREVEGGDVAALLAARGAPGDSLAVRLARAPGRAERDFLAALGRAGRGVRWEDAGVAPLAMSVEPARGPGARVTVSALAGPAPGQGIAIADAAGTLDSLAADGRGVALAVVAPTGALEARAGGTVARATALDSTVAGRVLVVGRAGWEGKFTVAALEEAGWLVDAALDVGPGARVVQGVGARAAPVPDGDRHAAVVVLDSATAQAAGAALARYARAGGGVVLAGSAARAPAVAAIRAGVAGGYLPGVAGAVQGAQPRRGLGAVAIARPGAEAVILERRDGVPVAAARRVGSGRVVQVGWDESWRWRMEGPDDAPAAHRAWWSEVVAGVARARLVPRALPDSLDPAPRAALVAALGPPAEAGAARPAPPRRPRVPDSLLLALACAALCGEWASRRLRGAR